MTTPPKIWHTREQSGIRLDRNGDWWHDGERIEHPKIVDAFNRGLAPTDDGKFKLTFGNDWCLVEVDDVAFFVRRAFEEEGGFELVLSDATTERLDPETLSIDAEGILRCRVKLGRARAKFSRQAQVDLGTFIDDAQGHWSLRLGDRAVTISAE